MISKIDEDGIEKKIVAKFTWFQLTIVFIFLTVIFIIPVIGNIIITHTIRNLLIMSSTISLFLLVYSFYKMITHEDVY